MPKIDFYILKDESSLAGYKFACKLIEKAYNLQHSLDILTSDQQSAQQIDDLLWTFKEGSFIPHEMYNARSINSPVLIGSNFENRHPAPNKQSVLVNLSEQVPSYFDHYERITEIVCGDASQRQQARRRFKFYRDKGIQPESHSIN